MAHLSTTGPKKWKAGDALGFIQRLAECRSWGVIAALNFGGDSQDDIKRSERALLQHIKGVVRIHQKWE